MAASRRFRNFATVVYPDSEHTPDHWMSILQDFKTPILVSPFHDQDKNVTGEPKKPHYHVLIMFEGMKSQDQVRDLFNQVGGVGLETVNSLRGYARYLCHLDNPDKYQYFPGDVVQMCGVDYLDMIGLPSDRYEVIGAMMDFCTAERETIFSRFVRYCKNYQQDWFRVLCDSGTVIMKEYLKGLEYELKNNDEVIDLYYKGDPDG